MSEIKLLIVDDEQHNRQGIKLLLQKYCPEIQVIGEVDSAESARNFIATNEINILLLDINMPKENGFELLKSLEHKTFLVVFVTAYAEYAIRAFKANAIDYLLKPLDPEELVEAMNKCRQLLVQSQSEAQKSMYYDSLQNSGIDISKKQYPHKLTLPYMNGFQIVAVENIIYIESEGNYANLHIVNQANILVTRGIKDFENLLDPFIFFRAHKSTILNLHFMKEYSSIEGPVAIMSDGSKLLISRRRLDEFMTAINQLSKRV